MLGPTLAEERLGGASSWGVVLSLYGTGSIGGGLALLGRSPRRALAWSMAASACWALPAAALAMARTVDRTTDKLSRGSESATAPAAAYGIEGTWAMSPTCGSYLGCGTRSASAGSFLGGRVGVVGVDVFRPR